MIDLEALSRAWDLRWGRPLSWELRHSANATWVRFHSLPSSKRYAETEAEYVEILRRHDAVLAALGASAVLVMSCAWSDSDVVDRIAELEERTPPSVYWRSSAVDDPLLVSRTHVYVGESRRGLLDELLRFVADDRTSGVIIAPPDLSWLYCPYDGGADVYAQTVAQRDALKATYHDWLSARSDGL